MYICTTCYLPHSPKKHDNMSNCEECGGYSVDIDDVFVAPIIELWKKGYKTISCCSGHSVLPYSTSVIMFDKSTILPCLPEGFELDKDDRIMIRSWHYLKPEDRTKVYKTDYQRIKPTLKLTVMERHLQLMDSLKCLTDWILNLPINEEVE